MRLTGEMRRDHHPGVGGATRTATMDDFDHILNWKLKAGSHPFPGKVGGTCINEAALVAAGFEYRPVRRAEDPMHRRKTNLGGQRPAPVPWSPPESNLRPLEYSVQRRAGGGLQDGRAGTRSSRCRRSPESTPVTATRCSRR